MTAMLALNLAALFGLLTALWVVSVYLEDASIIDPFWGAGFVVVAWICFWMTEVSSRRGYLVLLLVTVWGMRLSVFLLWRFCREAEEDRRYAAMRNARPKTFWWQSLFIVFWLQAALLWLISFPIQFTVLRSSLPAANPLGWIDTVAATAMARRFHFRSRR